MTGHACIPCRSAATHRAGHRSPLVRTGLVLAGMAAIWPGSPRTARAAPAGEMRVPEGGDGPGGIFSLPLPSPELPAGVLTVKVVGPAGMQDLRVGHAVDLLARQPGGESRLTRVLTGGDGRARFDGLLPGQSHVVQVETPGGEVRSRPFMVPARGGLRLLLSFGQPEKEGGQGASKAGGAALVPGHPPAGGPRPGLDASRGSGVASMARADDLGPGEVEVRVQQGRERRAARGVQVILAPARMMDRPRGSAAAFPGGGRRLLTDEKGRARASLDPDTGEPWAVMVVHDGMTYRSAALPLEKRAGVRVTFQVWRKDRDPSGLKLTAGTHLVCQVGEQVLSFMQVLRLYNTRDLLFDPGPDGLLLPLPEGASNIEVPPQAKDILTADEEGRQVRLLAPVPPGEMDLRYFFELPYDGPQMELSQMMTLPAEAGGMIAVLNMGQVRISGPAVADSREQAAPSPESKKQRVYMLIPLARGSRMELTISGLPHPDRGSTWAVLILSALLALWGLFAALRGPRLARARRARREQLLERLAALERDGRGQRGQREELTKELGQLWQEE